MPGENIWAMLGMLAMVIAILALAYFTTRMVGLRGGFHMAGQGGDAQFCLLRQVAVGRGESLALVRVGERCLLLGVTAESITLLRELEPEEAEPFLRQQEADASAPAFAQAFSQAMKQHLPGKKQE